MNWISKFRMTDAAASRPTYDSSQLGRMSE
jgi:hypothetical protein